MSIVWPPIYTLKAHPRARHVKLRATAEKGLEIITPLRFNPKQITSILEENKTWIIKQLHLIQDALQTREPLCLPETISLQALNKTWKIFYLKTVNKQLKLMIRHPDEIHVMGDTTDLQRCFFLLTRWVKRQAESYLIQRLNDLSQLTCLNFTSISVRGQKTRWGSCTSLKAISLNYKLIFLPEALVTHVLIHELCHTVHLNHSTRFWRLVAKFDPHWKAHSRSLRHEKHAIPMWL